MAPSKPPLPVVRLPSDSPIRFIHPTPLTPASFSAFGTAILPPLPPDLTTPPSTISSLPSTAFPASTGHAVDPVLANQGTAVKFGGISPGYGDTYVEAPSAAPTTFLSSPAPSTSQSSSSSSPASRAATTASGLWTPNRTAERQSKAKPAMTMFSCFSRPAHSFHRRRLLPTAGPASTVPPVANQPSAPTATTTTLPLKILERHPYTSQTFIPLSSSPAIAPPTFLIIVAPSLHTRPSAPPDLASARAFVASPGTAVTYGRGTWHAPMVVLAAGENDDDDARAGRIDFVVVQWASGVAAEDCQEVEVEWVDGRCGVEVVVDAGLAGGGGGGGARPKL